MTDTLSDLEDEGRLESLVLSRRADKLEPLNAVVADPRVTLYGPAPRHHRKGQSVRHGKAYFLRLSGEMATCATHRSALSTKAFHRS
jgi:hypothetical protein